MSGAGDDSGLLARDAVGQGTGEFPLDRDREPREIAEADDHAEPPLGFEHPGGRPAQPQPASVPALDVARATVPRRTQQPLRRARAAGAWLCERYELPCTGGPLRRQHAQVVKRVLRLALPGGESPTEHADADRQRHRPRAPPRPDAHPAAAAAGEREIRERARGAAAVISERASVRSPRRFRERQRSQQRCGLTARSTRARVVAATRP
jgi:hypothetical protein